MICWGVFLVSFVLGSNYPSLLTQKPSFDYIYAYFSISNLLPDSIFLAIIVAQLLPVPLILLPDLRIGALGGNYGST